MSWGSLLKIEIRDESGSFLNANQLLDPFVRFALAQTVIFPRPDFFFA